MSIISKGDKMNPVLLFQIIRIVYPRIRPILYEAIENPKHQWDELLMELLDSVMGYDETPF